MSFCRNIGRPDPRKQGSSRLQTICFCAEKVKSSMDGLNSMQTGDKICYEDFFCAFFKNFDVNDIILCTMYIETVY
jgi:hypothetical protein